MHENKVQMIAKALGMFAVVGESILHSSKVTLLYVQLTEREI